jgi:cation diffusion facilitator CzcD-associated flavoprotein CzcO
MSSTSLLPDANEALLSHSISLELRMREPDQAFPVIVVGAGAAGLATASCLKQVDVPSVIFEADDDIATTWRSLYDRLHLHTIKQLSGLPGFPMPAKAPRYLARDAVVAYLRDYARHFDLRIETGRRVSRAYRRDELWTVVTPQGESAAQALVSATGVFANPDGVHFPGQDAYSGRIEHGSTYREPSPYAGKRVLIVGSGNTGAEIAIDLAEHGVEVSVSIRAGANVVPRELLGIPIQRWAHVIAALPQPVTQPIAAVMLRNAARRQRQAGVPRPTESVIGRPGVPVIGLDFLRLAKSGKIAIRPGIQSFTSEAVLFADGREEFHDVVIFATGYRPALDYLDGLLTLDDGGRPARDGVRSTDQPDLYFVGMQYDIRGTLFNIGNEAPLAARQIAASRKQGKSAAPVR